MVDAELLAHQKTWHFFTNLIKVGIAVVIVVLAGLSLLV
jgi:hypothetical protein